MASICTTS